MKIKGLSINNIRSNKRFYITEKIENIKALWAVQTRKPIKLK